MRAVRDPHNVGFLREDAYLAVIVITANDDHSPQATSELAAAFDALKADPQDFIIAAISAPPDAGCVFDGASALPAPRLAAVANAFPNRSTLTTICEGDLTDGLVLFAGGIPSSPGPSPCLDSAPLQLPDGRYDCSVSDVQNPGTARQTEQLLPPCTPGGACPAGGSRPIPPSARSATSSRLPWIARASRPTMTT